LSHTAEITFAVGHPAAQGHFPGNPVIPGAVLLDEVLGAIRAAQNRAEAGFEILSVKFLRPVKPGARLKLLWDDDAAGRIQFQCLLSDQPAVSGTLRLSVPSR
jgi:3-hydroxymyristoyl/3-hydroxydecanoyl-(acyl carrier protein) dehydratase